MLQLPNACSVDLLVAGITLDMLEQATETTKLVLAIRAPVLIVLIPAVDVFSALVAFIG
jgi:hypothetical protein